MHLVFAITLSYNCIKLRFRKYEIVVSAIYEVIANISLEDLYIRGRLFVCFALLMNSVRCYLRTLFRFIYVVFTTDLINICFEMPICSNYKQLLASDCAITIFEADESSRYNGSGCNEKNSLANMSEINHLVKIKFHLIMKLRSWYKQNGWQFGRK